MIKITTVNGIPCVEGEVLIIQSTNKGLTENIRSILQVEKDRLEAITPATSQDQQDNLCYHVCETIEPVGVLPIAMILIECFKQLARPLSTESSATDALMNFTGTIN